MSDSKFMEDLMYGDRVRLNGSIRTVKSVRIFDNRVQVVFTEGPQYSFGPRVTANIVH